MSAHPASVASAMETKGTSESGQVGQAYKICSPQYWPQLFCPYRNRIASQVEVLLW